MTKFFVKISRILCTVIYIMYRRLHKHLNSEWFRKTFNPFAIKTLALAGFSFYVKNDAVLILKQATYKCTKHHESVFFKQVLIQSVLQKFLRTFIQNPLFLQFAVISTLILTLKIARNIYEYK